MVGTSKGEIYQMEIDPSHVVTENTEKKVSISEDEAITSMKSDPISGTLLVGTSLQGFHLFQLSSSDPPSLIKSTAPQPQVLVHSIGLLLHGNGVTNKYVAGLANGVVKIIDCIDGNLLAEIQAHSRSVNAIVAHP